MTQRTETVIRIVRSWMEARDRITTGWKLENSPLAIPEITNRTGINAFAKAHDDATRALVAEFADLNPVEFEALLELMGNVRKIVGFGDTGHGV